MPTRYSNYLQYSPGDPLAAKNWPGSAEGVPNPETYPTVGQLNTDSAVWDTSAGLYVNARTKKPWTGKLSNGMYAQNGKAAQAPSTTAGIDPNNPQSRYKPVDIVKTSDIAGETSDLLKQFKDGADKTLKGFDDYVRDFKTGASAAISREHQATDVAPVTAALAQAQSRYANSLGQASQDYQTLNQNTAAAETGVVQKANDLLPSFDTALNNAEKLAQQQVTGGVSRYAAGKNGAAGGANMGLGSDVANILAQRSYEASLPYEQAKIGKRYDILQNLDLPVQRDIASRETSRIAQFNPAVAAQQYGSDQETQLKIHSLKQAAAAQDWQTALQMLQVPAIAAQVRNQILAGDTALLGSLNQLYEQTHYQGLQDLMGVSVSQPVYYNQGVPGYPSPPPGGSRYSFAGGGSGNTGNSLPAPNAPVQVNPGGQQPSQIDYAYYMQTGVWPKDDPNFSQEAYNNIAAQFARASSSRYASAPAYVNPSRTTFPNWNDVPGNPAVDAMA